MLKIINIVCARPNFMKIAPIISAIGRRSTEATQMLVHTGQHYDEAMSASFFRDLRMPPPDINLEVGSGTHAEQTALVMLALEPVLVAEKPEKPWNSKKVKQLGHCIAQVQSGSVQRYLWVGFVVGAALMVALVFDLVSFQGLK